MEKLMIEAIKQFEKDYVKKGCRIENVYIWDSCMHSAMFKIEFIDKKCERYETYYSVDNYDNQITAYHHI